MLLSATRLHLGVLLAGLAAIVIWFLISRTTLGFQIRAVGANARAAAHGGISVGRVMLLAAALSATAFMAAATPFGNVLLAFALAHLTLTLAVLPIGPLAAYARAGDYSYGLVVWLWGGPMEPVVNIALALPLTLLFAIPSWHLVERPALRRLRARSVAPIDPSGLRAAPSRP